MRSRLDSPLSSGLPADSPRTRSYFPQQLQVGAPARSPLASQGLKTKTVFPLRKAADCSCLTLCQIVRYCNNTYSCADFDDICTDGQDRVHNLFLWLAVHGSHRGDMLLLTGPNPPIHTSIHLFVQPFIHP